MFVHTVNGLKKKDDTVMGVIGQLDNAGCYHSLDLMLRLGLGGAKGQMLIKVLKWIFSEAQDGKDIADRIMHWARDRERASPPLGEMWE